MATEDFAVDRSSKSEQIQLEKLLVGKQLKHWTVEDVGVWLKLTNEGVFSKYVDLLATKQIDGRALMTLDEENVAIDLLGTQHQINSFVQSIKTLKRRNGRKMSAAHRRRQSRRSNASLLNGINLDALGLPDSATPSTPSGGDTNNNTTTTSLQPLRSKTPNPKRTRPSLKATHSAFVFNSSPSSGPIRESSGHHRRTMTPTLSMSRSKSMTRRNKRTRHHASAATVDMTSLKLNQLQIAAPSSSNSIMSQTLPDMHTPSTHHAPDTPNSVYGGDHTPSSVIRTRQRTLSYGDRSREDRSSYTTADPTDKKALWSVYRSKEIYSAILFKRGKFNTKFRKRWFMLCARECKPHSTKLAGHTHVGMAHAGMNGAHNSSNNHMQKKKNGLHLRNARSMTLNTYAMPEVSMSHSTHSIEYDAKYDSPKTAALKSTNAQSMSMLALNDFPSTVPTSSSTNKIKLQRIKSDQEVSDDGRAPPSYQAPSLVGGMGAMAHAVSLDAADRATRQQHSAYLFYFNERPIKKSDNPNGYISLNHVQCVLGLLDEDEPELPQHDEKSQVKYKAKKGKQSEYYEIVLKTDDREWIFGALDSKSYLDWLVRLKKFEKK